MTHMKAIRILLVTGLSAVAIACGAQDQWSDSNTEVEPEAEISANLSAGAPVHSLSACRTSYDADVAAVRTYIKNNCGGIVSCGSGDTETHSDVFLNSGKYCSCYSKLWAKRATGSFAKVQVIYHEPQACTGAKHIHIQKKALCGRWHYDIDESTDGNCTHEEPANLVDRYTGGSSCALLHDTRVGTCDE
jgi:hypothetical protein